MVLVLDAYKVISAKGLARHFSCSTRTIFRKLKDTGYLTSYNMNGEMLTSPTTPDFDENGLWEYQGARFSAWKNLGPTIRALVDGSEQGLTAYELGRLLSHPNVHHHLLECVRKDQLVRTRLQGCSVYFSADPRRKREQEGTRYSERPAHTSPEQPPDMTTTELVWLLRAMVRCNHIPFEGIMAALGVDRSKVSEPVIRWLVEGCPGDGAAPTAPT
ncbi:MAG: hypothetical protein QF415_09875 [Candidatus Undinarchaeales archaeon]|nr:hypothetical protein [Candidatus Undinarchaeales archaeon]MDP7492861.1 hypothetical protein [Candidatus Undinarchaeales archaeon]